MLLTYRQWFISWHMAEVVQSLLQTNYLFDKHIHFFFHSYQLLFHILLIFYVIPQSYFGQKTSFPDSGRIVSYCSEQFRVVLNNSLNGLNFLTFAVDFIKVTVGKKAHFPVWAIKDRLFTTFPVCVTYFHFRAFFYCCTKVLSSNRALSSLGSRRHLKR